MECLKERMYEAITTDPNKLKGMFAELTWVLPELELAYNTFQNNPYHMTTVFEHTVWALNNLKVKDDILPWVLLLHDLGKPYVITIDPERGTDHFYEHELESYRIAKRFVEEMNFDERQKELIPKLVKYHDEQMSTKTKYLYKRVVQRGWDQEFINLLFEVQKADLLAHIGLAQYKMPLIIALEQKVKVFFETDTPKSVNDLPVSLQEIESMYNCSEYAANKMLEDVMRRNFYKPELNTRESTMKYLKDPKRVCKVKKFEKEGDTNA